MTIKKSLALLLPLAIIVAGMAISGCTSHTTTTTQTTTTGSSGTQNMTATVLTISGNVANPMQLSLSDLASYQVNQSGMGGFPGGRNATGNASFPGGGERNMTYGGPG
ncbi:MAG TPA: hypothetical protein VK436_13850, partial [Methanocella sp.]|nr:hypothetical protein [Methanocella sp.]